MAQQWTIYTKIIEQGMNNYIDSIILYKHRNGLNISIIKYKNDGMFRIDIQFDDRRAMDLIKEMHKYKPVNMSEEDDITQYSLKSNDKFILLRYLYGIFIKTDGTDFDVMQEVKHDMYRYLDIDVLGQKQNDFEIRIRENDGNILEELRVLGCDRCMFEMSKFCAQQGNMDFELTLLKMIERYSKFYKEAYSRILNITISQTQDKENIEYALKLFEIYY